MKKWVKISLMVLIMCVGYGVGFVQYNPKVRIKTYERGVTSFCNLLEEDRLKVCPLKRIYTELKTGGSVIYYVCSQDESFIETNDLSDLSREMMMADFKKYIDAGALKIEQVCDTDYGKVYRLSRIE